MRLPLFFYFVFIVQFAVAQTSDFVVVDSITVKGNRQTRKKTILRELDFTVNDTIPVEDFGKRLSANELRLMNTNLFASARINITRWDTENKHATVEVIVKESWYIYPYPIFELADRNFNVWWVQQNHDWRRINFGVRLYYQNPAGLGDLVKLTAQYGYTQKYEAEYNLPYINKKQTLGLSVNTFFTKNKEIGYTTRQNILAFRTIGNEELIRRQRYWLQLNYRPRLRNYHFARLEHHQNRIAEEVVMLNPDFFLNGSTQQRFLAAHYQYFYDNRDIKFYPINGSFFTLLVRKEGILPKDEINTLSIASMWGKYFPFTKRLSAEIITQGKVSLLRNKIPYFNYRALGFNETNLRGYEYYIVDGLDYGILKTSLRYAVLARNFNLGKYMALESFKQLPVKMFLTLNNDLGYVNDPFNYEHNSFSNRLLWGGGVGLDIILYYSIVFQIEYSMNHLREKAVYLHYKVNF
ncbi:MAG: BamA/TamA family outer membrane protein [Saprospiraceae bacterium]|nr:BamA/TamA family outer membrane protein [Saprospiraceae bacterium]MBP7699526.1 BamA/TamA family outer membrane protein [Saprospiraceae bacterium]